MFATASMINEFGMNVPHMVFSPTTYTACPSSARTLAASPTTRRMFVDSKHEHSLLHRLQFRVQLQGSENVLYLAFVALTLPTSARR